MRARFVWRIGMYVYEDQTNVCMYYTIPWLSLGKFSLMEE